MKYKPSVKANNSLRDEVAKKLQGLIFDVDKKRYNPDLNADTIKSVRDKLVSLLKNFEEVVGTGDEDVQSFYATAIEQIDDVKIQFKSNLSGRLESSVDDLDYTIDKWSAVLGGDVDAQIASEDIKKKNESRARRNLESKLYELKEIQAEYRKNEKRLEGEMANLERDIKELDDQIMEEENERKIGNLVSKVKAVKVKLAATNNTYRNYSFCSDLLDMIANLVGEKIIASDFSMTELSKAKAYLKIDDLKKVIAEPERAVATLKKMEDDLKSLIPKIENNQAKINSFGEVSAPIDNEALRYKEELMAKRNAKSIAKDIDTLGNGGEVEEDKIVTTKIEEEN